MALIECHVPGCEAPAELEGDYFSMDGAAAPGRIRVWFTKLRCLRGHAYVHEVFEEPIE